MESQYYCLRWNNYEANMTSVLPHLLQTQAFVDVTLACENRSVKAHKVVLSACSSYFQKLLENCLDPTIILPQDVCFSDLRLIVDFAYRGELEATQSEMESVFRSAELLKIKGLHKESTEGAQNKLVRRCVFRDATGSHYCLKWNNFESNRTSALYQMLQRETFVDVTLFCSEQSVKAHQVVLSACSSYFQKLFEHSCKHPTIIMPQDVSFTALKLIIEFVYKGEIEVSEEELQSLLNTADRLKIRGLCKVSDDGKEGEDVDPKRNLPQVENEILEPPGDLELKLETVNEVHMVITPEVMSTSEHKSPKNGKKWGQEEMRAALDALRDQTMSLRRASLHFNIPSTTLWERAHRLGIETPKNDALTKSWSEESLHMALDALRSGSVSAYKASKMYGIPSSTLCSIARKEGILLPFNAVSWVEEEMERALGAIRSGQSTVQMASKEFGIPPTTLYGRCKREGIELSRKLDAQDATSSSFNADAEGIAPETPQESDEPVNICSTSGLTS